MGRYSFTVTSCLQLIRFITMQIVNFSASNSHFTNESSSNETTQLVIALTRVLPFKQCESCLVILLSTRVAASFVLTAVSSSPRPRTTTHCGTASTCSPDLKPCLKQVALHVCCHLIHECFVFNTCRCCHVIHECIVEASVSKNIVELSTNIVESSTNIVESFTIFFCTCKQTLSVVFNAKPTFPFIKHANLRPRRGCLDYITVEEVTPRWLIVVCVILFSLFQAKAKFWHSFRRRCFCDTNFPHSNRLPSSHNTHPKFILIVKKMKKRVSSKSICQTHNSPPPYHPPTVQHQEIDGMTFQI